MSSPREWLYERLTTDASVGLAALIPGGVHASTSLEGKSPDKPWPFLGYRVIANRPEMRGDDGNVTKSIVVLIFIHDEVGSYRKIDLVAQELYAHLNNVHDGYIIRVTWLEVSEDFSDHQMGTNMRYIRIRIDYKES